MINIYKLCFFELRVYQTSVYSIVFNFIYIEGEKFCSFLLCKDSWNDINEEHQQECLQLFQNYVKDDKIEVLHGVIWFQKSEN